MDDITKGDELEAEIDGEEELRDDEEADEVIESEQEEM